MSEEARAIITAALSFEAADRDDDEAQAAYNAAPGPDTAARLDRADAVRWSALENILDAVQRYREAQHEAQHG